MFFFPLLFFSAPSLYGSQPVVMSPQDFDLLLNRVKRAGFASQKAQEVTLACAGGAVFTSEQGRLVLQEIRGDNEQKESALALYPRTIGDVKNQKKPVSVSSHHQHSQTLGTLGKCFLSLCSRVLVSL